MNGKELYELLTYLHEQLDEAIEHREAWKNNDDPAIKEQAERWASEEGMKASWLEYMIRLFEQKAEVVFR